MIRAIKKFIFLGALFSVVLLVFLILPNTTNAQYYDYSYSIDVGYGGGYYSNSYYDYSGYNNYYSGYSSGYYSPSYYSYPSHYSNNYGYQNSNYHNNYNYNYYYNPYGSPIVGNYGYNTHGHGSWHGR